MEVGESIRSLKKVIFMKKVGNKYEALDQIPCRYEQGSQTYPYITGSSLVCREVCGECASVLADLFYMDLKFPK